VKSREGPVPERLLVVNAHQLHEHVGDQHAQVLHVARLVQKRHNSHVGFLCPCTLCWRRGYYLQDSARLWWDRLLLDYGPRALSRRRSTLWLCILSRREGLRIHPRGGLWRLRGDRYGGGLPPLGGRGGKCSQWGDFCGTLAAGTGSGVGIGGLGRGVEGGGQAWWGVLCADVDVAPLAALR
jgi:hypothetical protein